MTLWQAAVLGVVQGLTEFLPISSSAHLALFPWVFHWRDPGLAFDVGLHWGTLLALALYFFRDWAALGRGLARAAMERRGNPQAGLALKLAVGSLPAAAAGVLLKDAAETAFRSLWVIAAMLAAVALLLWVVDRRAPAGPADALPGWGGTLLVGLAQAIAIVPGTSRSGITMAAALLVGLPRPAAARFSFLLSGPIILGAGLRMLKDLAGGPPLPLIVGLTASAAAGCLAIAFLLRHLERGSFVPFAAYRLVLAGFVVALLLARA